MRRRDFLKLGILPIIPNFNIKIDEYSDDDIQSIIIRSFNYERKINRQKRFDLILRDRKRVKDFIFGSKSDVKIVFVDNSSKFRGRNIIKIDMVKHISIFNETIKRSDVKETLLNSTDSKTLIIAITKKEEYICMHHHHIYY